MKYLSAKDHGRIGNLTRSKRARHNNGHIMSGDVAKELERLASKALGIKRGPPTKAEKRRPDTIRMTAPDNEVLFDTVEEDWMPEIEPWEVRFPDYYGDDPILAYKPNRGQV